MTRAMQSARPLRRSRADLVHSSEWFQQAVADALWIPDRTEAVRKPRRRRIQKLPRSRPRRRKKRKREKRGVFPKRAARFVRDRVSHHMRVIEPLLASWVDVTNFADEERTSRWRQMRRSTPQPAQDTVIEDDEEESDEEEEETVNSVVKLRLFPTSDQRAKLDQMFAANRAIYNKLVARSREDRLGIASDEKMTRTELMKKYRPIAILKSMSKYFRNNKRARARHKQVHDEVRDSAFRDFKKAVKSSLALFFAKKRRDEKTTYPDMKFKSKFSPSNTIEIRKRSVNTVEKHGQDFVRFHTKFFGMKADDGIALHERLPALERSVRLQHLREGEYYLIVPRLREFDPSKSERVCAIDPGVRKFATVYDPDGRTFSVKDARSVLKKKFEAVDEMKSMLAQMTNACKARRSTPHDRTKTSRSSEHRFRYRLRRRIHFTSRKATRAVNDMHQKLSSWLAMNYKQVLLPSFHTSEMVRRYFLEAAADATPETSVQKRKIRSPTARAMLAQAHYRFKMLLKYKMERAGGRLVECEEEYTSKTCSGCGTIKNNLGGSEVFRCGRCLAVYDRDVNAARNIFHKNMGLLL